MKFGKYDSLLLGAFAGILIAFNSIPLTIYEFFESIVPVTWDWFGGSVLTLQILIIATGALIGLIFDKTK